MDDLRRLIVGPEQGRIKSLEERTPVSPESIGEVLPEALAHLEVARREDLSIALEPSMTTALRTVARRDAEFHGEILSPTIGSAVRKAVADALAVMMQRFNEALERSLSLRSVQWRVESLRTGRSFAEVVLLHTLLYRVEEVFLIHPRTGLVLEHVTSAGAGVLEPDQVASMLMAIDAFAREAFAPQPAGTHIGHVQFGELALWIEQAPGLAVAAVVRGIAPHSLADLLRDTRERIYLMLGAALERFQSDVTPFAAARPLLERCLVEQRRPPPRRAQIWLVVAACGLLAAMVAIAAVRHANVVAGRRLLGSYVSTLSSEPGIVVTSAERSNENVRIRGLRDPLATAPAALFARRGLPMPTLDLVPYYSLAPSIVERRARERLEPPSDVSLQVVGTTLHVRGAAPLRWIAQVRSAATTIPGIDHLDDNGLRPVSAEPVVSLASAVAAVDGIEVLFPPGSVDPYATEGLERARRSVQQVVAAAADAHESACLSIAGHTDPIGPEARNVTLSDARARAVADDLIAHAGIARERVRSVGAGVWRAAGSHSRARSVTLHVDIGCVEGQ
jgi:OOP family OmpA-OmpF porin